MKAISVEIEGFGSIIKNVVYPLNTKGITVLYGENGAGKSTIPNAIVWALFGKMLKASKNPEPWDWVQDDNYRGTCVKYNYIKNKSSYSIIRCLNFKGKIGKITGGNKLIVLKDSKELDIKHKVNLKAWIVKEIGYSFELFKASVVFGQKLKRLMHEDNETKKKLLEETFETTFIQKARDEVDIRIKDQLAEVEKIDYNVYNLQSLEKSLNEHLEFVKKSIELQAENSKKDIKKLCSEIDQLEKDRIGKVLLLTDIERRKKKRKKKYKAILSKIDPKIENGLFKEEMNSEGLNMKVQEIFNKIKALKKAAENEPRTCPKCGEKLSKEKVMKAINANLKEQSQLNTQADELAKEISQSGSIIRGYKSQLNHQKKFKEKAQVHKKKLEWFDREYSAVDVAMKVILREIEIKKASIEKIKDNADSERLRQELITTNVKLLQLEIDIKEGLNGISKINKKLEVDRWLISQPLSNGGLKNYIFNTMLRKINKCLIHYTPYIGFIIKLSMDLESKFKNLQIKVFKVDKEYPYEDLSGGQQQLVDIVLALGLYDATTESKPFPFVFMDEIFESLTKKNIEVIQNILIEKSEKTPIHLITHNESFIGGKTIKIELNSKGQTQIK